MKRRWKPLLNIRKTYTYHPIASEINKLKRFDSIACIMKHYKKIIETDSIKRISPKKVVHYKEDEIYSVIVNELKKVSSMEISDLRNLLGDYGYNVNITMTKDGFRDFLQGKEFHVSSRLVKLKEGFVNDY